MWINFCARFRSPSVRPERERAARARGSEQQPIEMRSNRAVALARFALEPFAIEHGHMAVLVADQPRLLERAGDQGHRRPLRAEHDGEEFMTQSEAVAVDAILRGQQPASASLL